MTGRRFDRIAGGRLGGGLATAVLVAGAAAARPDVVLGLPVLGIVFVVAERVRPIVRQPVLRSGWRTDVVHFVVDQVVGGLLVAALAVLASRTLRSHWWDLGARLGGPAQAVVAATIGELAGYWGHRAMHRVPALWRLHSVHHSAPVMDWLAPNRRHVLDTALGQAASVVPLVVLGLSPTVLVGAFVLRRAQGLFVHANLRLHLPVLRWFVATPEFHHWHHSADPAHRDRNFAGQCPFVDWLFGTLHMPAREWPAAYGIADGADAVPPGYLARLVWPFRPARQRRPVDRRARRPRIGAVGSSVRAAVDA